MDKTDLAWAAGFYEGEGNIYANIGRYSNGRPRINMMLSISQVDKDPLLKFLKIFPGGKIYLRSRSINNPNHSDISVLVYNGSAAISVFDAMRVYLSERRVTQFDTQISRIKEAVEERDKMPKKQRSLQSHCKRGHEFTTENTYVTPDKRRVCKACRAIADEKRRQQRCR